MTYEDGFCAGGLHLVSQLISVIGSVRRRDNAVEVMNCVGSSHVVNLCLSLATACGVESGYMGGRELSHHSEY